VRSPRQAIRRCCARLDPAQLEWQHRIRAELDNLQAAVTWAMASGGQARQFAFRIVAALASLAVSPGTVGGWAEACVAQFGACPPELRAAVLAGAAWSAFYAGDVQLAQRRAEDALREPATGDPAGFGLPRLLLSRTYSLTGQPERGASIVRDGRREAADLGGEFLVGMFYGLEAMAWTDAGDHAAARRPAMDALETARRAGNPALSALACYVAAAAIWTRELQSALMLVEESLALARRGALDSVFGFALSLAGAIRARNGDLPGALAVLQEATGRLAGDGNRLGLGMTLERATAVLVRLGEFEPAAVLAGADLARFALSVAAIYPDERLAIDEAQATARGALGEAAYSSALGRGAAMDDAKVTDYALGQFRRLAALIGKPGERAPESPSGVAQLSGTE
jgi:hypothetical protein